MAVYLATCFFEQGGHGWSETYARDGGGVTNLAALADFDRDTIWGKRAKCCGLQTRIFAQRVSFTDQLGDSQLNYIDLQPNTFESEDANTAVLVVGQNSNNTRRKNIFMRGVADAVVVLGGEVDRGFALFDASFKAWRDAMIQNAYGWIGTQANTEHPVLGYTTDAENRIVFTLGGPGIAAPAVGNKVRVRGKNMGIGKPSVLNSTFVCIRDNNTSVKTNKPTAAFPYPGTGGFLVTKTTNLITMANIRLQKVVERKAGKPSYVSAGRAAVRPRG